MPLFASFRYKNGKELEAGDKYQMLVEEEVYILVIVGAQEGDLGEYSISATNTTGTINAAAQLLITGQSKVFNHPRIPDESIFKIPAEPGAGLYHSCYDGF